MQKELNLVEVKDLCIIQKLLIILLREFHNICEENGLIYNMACGTMLGAVRHKGIIPWDDDIDVSMPRPDFEKFLKLVKQQTEIFNVFSYGDVNYPQPFAKFGFTNSQLIEHGLKDEYANSFLFIDVFPIDGMPDGIAQQNKHFKKLMSLKNKRVLCVKKTSLSPIISKRLFSYMRNIYATFLSNVFGVEYFLNKEVKEAQKYPFETSTNVSCAFDSARKGMISKDEYLDRKKYKFGNYMFWGVRNFNSYLNKMYGNYRQYPPIDKQKPNHNYTLYIDQKLLDFID